MHVWVASPSILCCGEWQKCSDLSSPALHGNCGGSIWGAIEILIEAGAKPLTKTSFFLLEVHWPLGPNRCQQIKSVRLFRLIFFSFCFLVAENSLLTLFWHCYKSSNSQSQVGLKKYQLVDSEYGREKSEYLNFLTRKSLKANNGITCFPSSFQDIEFLYLLHVVINQKYLQSCLE